MIPPLQRNFLEVRPQPEKQESRSSLLQLRFPQMMWWGVWLMPTCGALRQGKVEA
jgi:hypothetical protein